MGVKSISTTIKDLVDYVQSHPKRDAVWREWTDTQLAKAIQEAYEQNALCWCETGNKVLRGIIVGRANTDTKTLHIVGIICDDKQVLGQFLREYYKRFGPTWTLTGNRNGKLKVFNARKLCYIATSQVR